MFFQFMITGQAETESLSLGVEAWTQRLGRSVGSEEAQSVIPGRSRCVLVI